MQTKVALWIIPEPGSVVMLLQALRERCMMLSLPGIRAAISNHILVPGWRFGAFRRATWWAWGCCERASGAQTSRCF